MGEGDGGDSRAATGLTVTKTVTTGVQQQQQQQQTKEQLDTKTKEQLDALRHLISDFMMNVARVAAQHGGSAAQHGGVLFFSGRSPDSDCDHRQSSLPGEIDL